nr:hypothetical protein [Armatimonas sp.]
MITYGGRFKVSLETYHGVPAGWSKTELIAIHRALGGSFMIASPEATEPGAPSWLPDRKNWLQYRATLYKIADGVRAKDPACIELAVRYIELHYIGSYSGYLRTHLARGLKHASLSAEQKERLDRVFLSMVKRGDYTCEFREYVKIWQHIASPEAIAFIRSLSTQHPPNTQRPWLQKFASVD